MFNLVGNLIYKLDKFFKTLHVFNVRFILIL